MARPCAVPALSGGARLLSELIGALVPLQPALEVPDPLSEPAPDLGQAGRAEQHDDDEQDDEQLWDAETRHKSGSWGAMGAVLSLAPFQGRRPGPGQVL